MAKLPHTRGEMRAFYPVCQVAELAASYRDTTRQSPTPQDAENGLPSANRGTHHGPHRSRHAS